MKNHEASEDVTEGGILFPGSKTSVMEANTQTDGKTEIYAFEHTRRRPEHVPCAPSIPQVPRACILCTLRRSNHSLCAPSIAECWPKLFFTTFQWEKAQFLGPNSGVNFPYKYHIPHSQFLIKNEAVQEEGKYEASREEFISPHSKFLQGMFYLFCNLSLVTMSN